MLIALGKENSVRAEDIVAVFDLDITSQSALTRRFLLEAEKSGKVVNTAEDIPKSFVVCAEDGKDTVYLHQLSPGALIKRI